MSPSFKDTTRYEISSNGKEMKFSLNTKFPGDTARVVQQIAFDEYDISRKGEDFIVKFRDIDDTTDFLTDFIQTMQVNKEQIISKNSEVTDFVQEFYEEW